jgi:hypothetical protein
VQQLLLLPRVLLLLYGQCPWFLVVDRLGCGPTKHYLLLLLLLLLLLVHRIRTAAAAASAPAICIATVLVC